MKPKSQAYPLTYAFEHGAFAEIAAPAFPRMAIADGREFETSHAGSEKRTSAPVIKGLLTAHGLVVDGESTIDQSVSITGTAQASARVIVKLDGVGIGTVTANRHGKWTLDHTGSDIFPEGDHEITAVAKLGGRTSRSDSFDFSIGHEISLATLSSDEGLVVKNGLTTISAAGDINGDGLADFAIPTVFDNAASVAIVFGTGDDLGSITDGQSFLELTAIDSSAGLYVKVQDGRPIDSISPAGDVNGDGIDDFIIGISSTSDGGNALVIFGSRNGLGTDIDGKSVLETGTLAPASGFLITGDGANDGAGESVAGLGDINGDGFDDLIVGAPGGDDNGSAAGESYVVFGRASGFGTVVEGRSTVNLSALGINEGFIITGAAAGDESGESVSAAGDVNGDGFADLLIGARHNDLGASDAGEAYVIFGKAAGFGHVVGTGQNTRRVIDLDALGSTEGFVVQNDKAISNFGLDVSAAGDINGDGFGDIVVASRQTNNGNDFTGLAHIIFGSTSNLGTADGAGRSVVDIASLAPFSGFGIVFSDGANEPSARSVSAAGDVNGDGFDDLLVSNLAGGAGTGGGGETYLLFGTDQGFGVFGFGHTILDLADFSRRDGIIISASTQDDGAGFNVSSAGDINNDGFDDIMISSPFAILGGSNHIIYGGVFGGNLKPVKTSGNVTGETFYGGAGNDILDGNGGADKFMSGAGNDTIRIGDGTPALIRAGTGGRDKVVIEGGDVTFDARNFASHELTGIETFDLKGTGANTLIFEAEDVFDFSNTGNAAFTAAKSHNNLVILGNSDDSLDLIDYATLDAEWLAGKHDVTLAGKKHGTFDLYHLTDADGDVLASVAVDADVTLL